MRNLEGSKCSTSHYSFREEVHIVQTGHTIKREQNFTPIWHAVTKCGNKFRIKNCYCYYNHYAMDRISVKTYFTRQKGLYKCCWNFIRMLHSTFSQLADLLNRKIKINKLLQSGTWKYVNLKVFFRNFILKEIVSSSEKVLLLCSRKFNQALDKKFKRRSLSTYIHINRGFKRT